MQTENIKVKFQSPDNLVQEFDVKYDLQIQEFKQIICSEITNLSPERVILYYQGLEMTPETQTLRDFGILHYLQQGIENLIESQIREEKPITFTVRFLVNQATFPITVKTTDTWQAVRLQISQKIMDVFTVYLGEQIDVQMNPTHMAMIKEGRDLLYENQVSYYNPKDGEIIHAVFRKEYQFILKD